MCTSNFFLLQEISQALKDLDSELNLANLQPLNKEDTTPAALFQSTTASRKDDRRTNRPMGALDAGMSGRSAAESPAVAESATAGSVYDFSASKAETPPVPLQKSRREAAAKSPRQVTARSSEVAASCVLTPGSKTEKQPAGGSTKHQQQPQPEAKKNHLQQQQQQPQQPHQQPHPQLQQAQHHQVQPLNAVAGSASGSSSNNTSSTSSYQPIPELGYMDSR